MTTACFDIGAGTQDILVFASGERIENAIKLILPAPTKTWARVVSECSGDLFIDGDTVGGGPFNKAVRAHMEQGRRVFMTRSAARTMDDDLDRLAGSGVRIVEAMLNPDITLSEFDWHLVAPIIRHAMGDAVPDVIHVAAQDHGHVSGQSDRVTRFEFLKKFLAGGLKPAFFPAGAEIPASFTRWRSLKARAEYVTGLPVAVGDTAVIAALGASTVTPTRPLITIDVGNAHTFAALVGENDRLIGFFEHHTSCLTPASMQTYLDRLAAGIITFAEVFDDSGHGAHLFDAMDAGTPPIVVTGPRRRELFVENERVTFAAPAGDTMITGPVGQLVQAGVL